MTASPWSPAARSEAVVRDGSDYPAERLAELYVEGMRPHWDWWIDERGGADAYTHRVSALLALRRSDDELWLVGELGGSAVGLVGATKLGEEEAQLEGVYVLPAYPGLGVGSVLLRAALDRVREQSARLAVVETISPLDADFPSLHLYRRSGGRLRAEYLHLQREEGRRDPRRLEAAPW